MAELLMRMLVGVTLGLALVLLWRHPARRAFGAGAAFTLWLLPLVLALAPLLPEQVAPRAMIVVPGLTVTPHVAAPAAASRAAMDWAQWLSAIWLAGAAGALLRLAMHYVRLLQGLRSVPEAWPRALAKAVPGLDMRRLRVHDAGPAVLWALPGSLILLPADFTERFDNAASREVVLRHELTHARRGDAWWSLAMEIASALLWFHPLAWVARPRFRLDQELACDASSLRAAPERTAHYARALLDSVAVRPAPALIPWLAEPQLKERIAMISRIPPGALRRRAGFVAIAAVLAGGLYVVGGQAPVFAAIHSNPAAPSVDVTWKNAHPPHYPAEALHKHEQGMVVLDVTIDARGHVSGVAVDPKGTTAAAILQDAAMAAAKEWRYAPGHKHGKAVGGVVRIPVNFSLTEDGPTAGASASSSPSVDISYKDRNPPHYPKEAIRKGEQGNVVLDVTVDATGKVTGVQVDQHGTDASTDLQVAAIQGAENWKFNPGREDGKPIGGVIQVPVNFSLNGDYSDDHTPKPCPVGSVYETRSSQCVKLQSGASP
ncbi:MAG TPA: M56 family metallopeptidase [Rhodanobacteraceae bacterium]|nr:M56 family metallopeptidase [Rhodanobacteraceae bacterium]